jgi:hypothetical protein
MIPATRTVHALVLLRAISIAIAVGGFVDPAVTMSGTTPARLAIVVSPPGSAAAETARARLVRDLAASYEIVPQITSDTAAAVVIGERYPDEPVPEDLLVATVSTAAAPTSGVQLVRVDAPGEVPVATTIHIDADVEALGLAGRSTDVTASVAGLEVGRTSHLWTTDRERWRGGIDAVPVGEPPWVVRVALAEAPGMTAGSRSMSDVVVDVRRSPFRVEIYEPRPSWATTFVRRALEADARFEVAGVSVSSRGISVRTGEGAPLSDPRLDAADVVVVGGLDRLSAAAVRSLDRFMRERGGAVALVPDARVNAGPVLDLLPNMTERLLERPAKLSMAPGAAPLEASELLLLGHIPPGVLSTEALAGAGLPAEVLAKAGGDGSPVIVTMPRGSGRLLVSGAMDAWRFRAADNGAFDRFWQATLAGLALAAPSPLEISVAPPLLRPLEKGVVTVRVRPRSQPPISASIDGEEVIRLRPEPEPGLFRGIFTARATPGRSTVEVRLADLGRQSASRTVLVQDGSKHIAAEPALSMLASSHRGIDVTPDRIAELEPFLRGAVTLRDAAVERRPMRSPWWILPFGACLSAEWWIRRRRGCR